jgi:hypothetical protein
MNGFGSSKIIFVPSKNIIELYIEIAKYTFENEAIHTI